MQLYWDDTNSQNMMHYSTTWITKCSPNNNVIIVVCLYETGETKIPSVFPKQFQIEQLLFADGIPYSAVINQRFSN